MKSNRIGSTAPIPEWKEERIPESAAEEGSFDPQTLQREIEEAGVPVEDAQEIAEEVAADVQPGMTTQDVDSRVRILLRLRDPQWEEDWINSRPESRKLWMTKVADVKTVEDLEPRT